MGALPSQKYEEILIAFMNYHNRTDKEKITQEEIKEFLRKADRREINI